MATAAEVQKRKEEFLNSTEAPAFSCIGNSLPARKDFVDALEKRCQDPTIIAQANTSLCGPAAFLYCIAQGKPDDFALYVLDLALSGEASLGGLKVTPGPECRNGHIAPKGQEKSIAPVDWVALASLRDSSNALFPMARVDARAGGATLGGELAEWFRKTGWFADVRNRARVSPPESINNLLEINALPASYICLLINARIMGGGSGWPNADHWIVLGDGQGAGGGTAGSASSAKIWITTDGGHVVDYLNRALMTTTKKEAPSPVGDDPGCPPGQEISFCDPNSGPKSQEKIRLGKGRINFQVYSWGGPVKADGTKTGIKPIDLAPQHTGRLTLETFLKHYFGYVAARLK